MPAPFILLIDDDPEDRMLIKLALEESGLAHVDVTEIGSGETLFAYLKRMENDASSALPGFIMLDISMPRVDGLTALKAIRSTRRFDRVPVVMCSTSSQSKVVEECLKLGANEYRSKPSDFDSLIKQMCELVETYGLRTERA